MLKNHPSERLLLPQNGSNQFLTTSDWFDGFCHLAGLKFGAKCHGLKMWKIWGPPVEADAKLCQGPWGQGPLKWIQDPTSNIIQWCAMWAMYILDFFQHWYHEGSQRLGTYNSGWKYGDLGVFFLLVTLGRKKKRSRCAAKTRNCDSRCSERRLVLMSGCFFDITEDHVKSLVPFVGILFDNFWQLNL